MYGNIILFYDGYGAYLAFRSLVILRQNNVIVVALLAHTSHRTQVLDYNVFSPYNSYFRNAPNRLVVAGGAEKRNDVYTLCEILNDAYNEAVTPKNIINGFRCFGLWCNVRKGVLIDVTRSRT